MRYGYIAPYNYSDRMYDGGYDKIPYPKDFLIKNLNFSANEYEAELPCWSLAALLQVLPLGIYDELDDRDYELEINMIDKMPRYVRLGDVYHSQFPYDFEKDTLLDNVVESIIWLNNNNYFEL
jgi:hypothetical protein